MVSARGRRARAKYGRSLDCPARFVAAHTVIDLDSHGLIAYGNGTNGDIFVAVSRTRLSQWQYAAALKRNRQSRTLSQTMLSNFSRREIELQRAKDITSARTIRKLQTNRRRFIMQYPDICYIAIKRRVDVQVSDLLAQGLGMWARVDSLVEQSGHSMSKTFSFLNRGRAWTGT
jgi:hypothetical protein